MYQRYLRKKLPLYLIGGILCSVLLGANITVVKYNRGLAVIRDRMSLLQIRKDQIARDTEVIQERLQTLRGFIPGRFENASERELILWAADTVQARMRQDRLVLMNMNKGLLEVSLPLVVTFDFDGYSSLLKRLQFLENMAFPFYRFMSFTFKKDSGGTATCTIKGELTMPPPGGFLR